MWRSRRGQSAFGTSGSRRSRSSQRQRSSSPRSRAARARRRSDAVAVVTPALVNINTNLAYQGASAAGTGIVLTSDGEVVTNNHVIRGATTIRATDVGNGRTYKATVVGYDVAADIAVLKLQNASGLTTAKLGDSDKVRVGDAVVAVGNAGGVGGTPSSARGSIVGVGRSITASDGGTDSEKLTGLIETNAQLQPGDSGGSLVDVDGHVIGIDTAAGGSSFQPSYGMWGGNSGSGATHGFAIPINKALAMVKQIQRGHATSTTHIGKTALLGVSVGSTPADTATSTATRPRTAPSSRTCSGLGRRARRPPARRRDHRVDGRRSSSSAATLTACCSATRRASRSPSSGSDQYGSSHRASVRLMVGPPQ